ncbi:hypothetical protein BC828DRAFT_100272 [Blastocladiella britannica]|nr:hypothetical protein BC828DRAFT_100272 [Blastocladiella britannica]
MGGHEAAVPWHFLGERDARYACRASEKAKCVCTLYFFFFCTKDFGTDIRSTVPLHTYSDVSADTPRFLDPELESIVHDLEATLGAPIYTAHTRTLAWRITTDRESVAACAVLDKQSVIAIDVDGPPEPLGVDTLQAACVPVLGAPSLVFVWDMVAVAATARRRVLASLRAVLAGPKARSILIHSPERDLARLRSVLEIPVRDKDVVDTQAMAGEWVTWSTEAWRVLGAPPPPLPLVKDSFTAPLPCLEPSVEREPPIERVESWLSTLFCGMSLFGRGDEAVHVEPALVPHESQPLLSDPTDSAFGRSWSSSYGAMTAPSTSRDSDLVISRLAPPVLLLQSHAMRPSLNATLAATRRPYNWCKEVPLGIDHRAVAADRRCVSWTLIDPAKDAASNAEAARFEARVLDVDQMMQAHEHMRESIAFIREWMEGRSSFAATVNGEAGQEQ